MQDFTGIAEKLVRAKENIFNLDIEIERFFQESDYTALPQDDSKLLLEAIEYHKNLIIPPRFSVLTGEVIHHLRSCFDHIIWHFTTEPIKRIRQIGFPVFTERPVDKNMSGRFERKIEGINNLQARTLIESLQPYNSPDPTSSYLFLIHNLDIIDKHRELVLCSSCGTLVLPAEMERIIEGYKGAHPNLDAAQIARQFEGHGVLKPNIAFRNFGGEGKIEPVISGLMTLFNYAVRVIENFMAI